MQTLWSGAGRQALNEVMCREPLLAFDFDGTLAPIVQHPPDARVSVATSQRLQALMTWRPVAIVTGRQVADVRPRLGFEPSYVVGSHGAEDPAGLLRPPDGLGLERLRKHLLAQAARWQPLGIEFEDKGQSLALHFRQAPDALRAEACIAELLSPPDPAVAVVGGKCVVNVTAAGAPDKGDAVASLVQRSGSKAAVFVGDDLNDESVFARAPAHWLTVRVGADAQSQARWFLPAQTDLQQLLDEMLALRRVPDGAGRPAL